MAKGCFTHSARRELASRDGAGGRATSRAHERRGAPATDEASAHEARTARDAAADAAMRRYADGDPTAFDALYALLAPPLRRYLLARCGDRAHAEDLLQQTMLQLHLTRERYARGARVLPWAIALARRKLIDGVRGARRGPATTPLSDAHEGAHAGGAIDEEVHARRLVRALDATLSRLPEAQRVAFALVQCDGVPTREAAARLGVTENAVKLRAFRACEAVRAALRGGA